MRYLFFSLVWGYLFYRFSIWDFVGLALASSFLLIAIVGFIYRDETRQSGDEEEFTDTGHP